jgi:hypothetical protein
MRQWICFFALNLVWCPCYHSFIAKVFHFHYSWRCILQVMHLFFEQNNLSLVFKASAIELFFILLFIATSVMFTFWCRHWEPPSPPFFVVLACGFATILPFFLCGCDVVISSRCCLTFFLHGIIHLQHMPQSLNARTMVSTVHKCC